MVIRDCPQLKKKDRDEGMRSGAYKIFLSFEALMMTEAVSDSRIPRSTKGALHGSGDAWCVWRWRNFAIGLAAPLSCSVKLPRKYCLRLIVCWSFQSMYSFDMGNACFHVLIVSSIGHICLLSGSLTTTQYLPTNLQDLLNISISETIIHFLDDRIQDCDV